MRMQALATRALLSGLAYERLPTIPGTSSNPNQGLIAIGTGNNLAASCVVGETTCGIGCMPLASVCCSGKGYCDPGEYCTERDTCCPIGKTCSPGGGCDAGKVLCGNGCMPAGAVCCPDYGYCDAGEVCTDHGTCAVSSGGGGSGGGSGGGGGGGGGGSGGSSTCSAAGKEQCDAGWCMPLGSVCCATGEGWYCDAGYYCTPTGCCRNGRTCSSSGGGGGGGGGSGNPPPITTTSQTQALPATSSSSSSSSSSVAAPPPPVQTENSVSDGGRPGATMPVRPTLSVDDGLDDVTTPSSTPMSSTTSTSSASARAAQSTGLPAGDGAQPGGAGLVSVSVGLVMAGVLGVVGFMLPIF
ncbi:hypothetical protein SMACR_03324 [Sordaria macrospora]|uniref:Uncharacterized protein n=1 Tax=Sordaria macrospora TaxID=5147 RepID=A0A8S9A071_SORMA|nr:hypothetical protein SMACR_03324 [Sordaria macrospora]WPJ66717.1 hypothetical protein SMAC4_03324 [Sordaria macrospora]